MCHGQNSLWTELLALRQEYVRPFWQLIKLRVCNALDIVLHFAPLLCLTKTSSQQLFQEISQPKALLQRDFLGPTGRTRGPTGRTACKLSLKGSSIPTLLRHGLFAANIAARGSLLAWDVRSALLINLILQLHFANVWCVMQRNILD